MKTFEIKFDNTCGENWEEMTAQAKGKFCGLCSKTVVDFTGKSSQEIVSYLKNNKNACGRMTSSQLGDPVIDVSHNFFGLPHSRIASKLMMAATIGAIALGNASEIKDNTPQTELRSNSTTVSDVLVDTKSDTAISTMKRSSTLKGTVTTQQDGKPVENARVTLFTLTEKYVTYTNAQGEYALKVPSHVLKDKNVVELDYSSVSKIENQKNYYFSNEVMVVSKEEIIKANKKIFARPDYSIMGGMRAIRIPEFNPTVIYHGKEIPKEEVQKMFSGKKTKFKMDQKNMMHFTSEVGEVLLGKEVGTGLYVFYKVI